MIDWASCINAYSFRIEVALVKAIRTLVVDDAPKLRVYLRICANAYQPSSKYEYVLFHIVGAKEVLPIDFFVLGDVVVYIYVKVKGRVDELGQAFAT